MESMFLKDARKKKKKSIFNQQKLIDKTRLLGCWSFFSFK